MDLLYQVAIDLLQRCTQNRFLPTTFSLTVPVLLLLSAFPVKSCQTEKNNPLVFEKLFGGRLQTNGGDGGNQDPR